MPDETLPTLDTILTGDFELALPGARVRFTNEPLGDLVVPTGKLLVRDPLSEARPAGLARGVPKGRYAASLRVRRSSSSPLDNVAFLVVRFSERFLGRLEGVARSGP